MADLVVFDAERNAQVTLPHGCNDGLDEAQKLAQLRALAKEFVESVNAWIRPCKSE